MSRRVLAITLLLLFLPACVASAQSAEVIATDMLYGAAIGALLGAVVYVFDQDDLGDKLMYGAAIGTVGGLAMGVIDAQSTSIVQIEEDGVDLNAPVVAIEERVDPLEKTSDYRYRLNLLSYSY
jgi:hypothetical protein